MENYIGSLHQKYKPKTVKRKIASVKALFHYLEYKEIIARNPFNKVQIKFREPVILPKTIPLHTIEIFLSTIYEQRTIAKTDYQRKNALRDAAVIELLFATGMRISELCALRICDIDLYDGSVLIYGKGSKERIVQIGNHEVIQILSEYRNEFLPQMETCQHFFATLNGTALSDQSVRRMINKYASLAAIEQHITPHMFRHTFATSLLEADVDIRYYTGNAWPTALFISTEILYACCQCQSSVPSSLPDIPAIRFICKKQNSNSRAMHGIAVIDSRSIITYLFSPASSG